MADPHEFEGVRYDYGSPSSRDIFKKLAGPEMREEIVKYKMGEADRPDTGYDYLMKSRRSEEDALFLDWYLKNQESQWAESGWSGPEQTGYSPTPVPTPSPLDTALGITLMGAGESGKNYQNQ